jgi:DNA-binding NtrC family response regulator
MSDPAVPVSSVSEPLSSERPPGFAGLVGASPAMKAVFERIRRFAGSVAPVYILGETGTGKEQVARAIHHESRRARHPFVAVNAAAIADELFDSEMLRLGDKSRAVKL